jgi:hypothetical protein
MKYLQLYLGIVLLICFKSIGLGDSYYDVKLSMQLLTDKEGSQLVGKIAEIQCYFHPGQKGMSPFMKLEKETPLFSITDPEKIRGFFRAFWTYSPMQPTPASTDGLEFVVVMKDQPTKLAYFHGYMSQGELEAVTPATGADSCSGDVPMLNKYLQENYPDLKIWHQN